MLCGYFDDKRVRDLAEQVVAEGYELDSFCIAVTVPLVLSIRQRAAWLLLRDTAAERGLPPPGPYERVVELKEALRWRLSARLQPHLRVGYEVNSPLQLQLCASFEEDGSVADEIAILQPLLLAGKGGNYRQTYNNKRHKNYEEDLTISMLHRALSAPGADKVLRDSILTPPRPRHECLHLALLCEHAPLLLTGRYNKLSRQLPQTAWIIDGARKCESSVQELIDAPALRLFRAESARFHSAGREDVDVRMLGDGRPFVLELAQPRVPHALASLCRRLEAEVEECGLVRITGVKACDASLVGGLIKAGEDAHQKDYRAIVRTSTDFTQAELEQRLTAAAPVTLEQLTPMRVLHRRTLAVRPRTIHAMKPTRIGLRFFTLDLTTQAGTYVKEFVHGDFGRTTPSVGTLLGCEADILQLDVLGLHDS